MSFCSLFSPAAARRELISPKRMPIVCAMRLWPIPMRGARETLASRSIFSRFLISRIYKSVVGAYGRKMSRLRLTWRLAVRRESTSTIVCISKHV